MDVVEYEAILSQQEAITAVRVASKRIASVGGAVEMSPPTRTGMVIVTLRLPENYQPQQFFPGLPFYPI